MYFKTIDDLVNIFKIFTVNYQFVHYNGYMSYNDTIYSMYVIMLHFWCVCEASHLLSQ